MLEPIRALTNLLGTARATDVAERCAAEFLALVEAAPVSDTTTPDMSRAIADFLDALARPMSNDVLIAVCDRLLQHGLTDPIVPASYAQAILNAGSGTSADVSGGPTAAIALIDHYIDTGRAPATAHEITLRGMRARAYKELFARALKAGDRDRARTAGAASLHDYLAVVDPALALAVTDADTRSWLWRWPMTNALVVGLRLVREGWDTVEGVGGLTAELNRLEGDLRERVEARIAARGSGEEIEPWDEAALAEIALAADRLDDAKLAVVRYVAALKAGDPDTLRARAETRLYGTVRQWLQFAPESEISNATLLAMMQILLAVSGSVPISRRSVRASDAVLAQASPGGGVAAGRSILEAYFGDGEFVDVGDFAKLIERARGIAAIYYRGERIATGFAVRRDELGLPPGDAAGELVLLTNAHVVAWPDRYADSAPLGEISARFEFVDPDRAYRLKAAWPTRHDPAKLGWLDASVLAFAPDQAPIHHDIAPIPLRKERSITRGTAYVIGHPERGRMRMAVGRNEFVAPPFGTSDAEHLLFYKTRTAFGHSGSPIIVPGDDPRVVGLHIGGQTSSNCGLALAALADEIAAARAGSAGAAVAGRPAPVV